MAAKSYGTRPHHEDPAAPGDGEGAGEAQDELCVSSMTSKELGRLGEDLAVRHLRDIGYEIIERNYRCNEGEADIVAYDPAAEAVVLVEVKTRRSGTVEDGTYPEESVSRKKQRRYRRIAACFLMENFPVPSIRFDVIGVTVAPDRMSRLHHSLGTFDWWAGR